MSQTTFPQVPNRHDRDLGAQVWTVWTMLKYLANNVYDRFVASFVSGSATVVATTTTIVVTHSLNAATYAVMITPIGDPGGRYWVSAKTVTQFTINMQVAAGGSGQLFDWMVKA